MFGKEEEVEPVLMMVYEWSLPKQTTTIVMRRMPEKTASQKLSVQC
jgi:hypothetical protein